MKEGIIMSKDEKVKVNYQESWGLMKKVWVYGKKYKKYAIIGSVLLLVIGAIGIATPILHGRQIIYLTSGQLNDLITITLIIFAIELIRWLLNLLFQQNMNFFSRKTTLDIREAIAAKMLQLKISELDKRGTGVYIERLSKDSQEAVDNLANLIYYIMDIVGRIGVYIAVFVINKYVFVFFVVVSVALYAIEHFRVKYFFESWRKIKLLEEKNASTANELIRGLKDIKVLNASGNFKQKIMQKFYDTDQENANSLAIRRKFTYYSNSATSLSSMLFIFFGIMLYTAKRLTLDNFVTLFMFSSRISGLNTMISAFIDSLKSFNLAAGRIFKILDDTEFEKEIYGTTKLKNMTGNIEFKDVKFAYKTNQEILKGVNFTINPDETVAFIGPSGSGKTTIFSLLTKQYTAEDNQIFFDGIDINQLDSNSLHSNVSIITQDPYIFNFSIKDNLKIVKPNLTKKEMIDVCKKTDIHDYIMSLPDKYDTIVGEGGLILSGGQKQRLAIARALIKKSEIILFDEATSSLDNETQKKVTDSINKLKNKTVLIIAHRLSTVINADRIFIVDDGKIKATGTHEELLKSNKLYKKLYKTELIDEEIS